MCMLDALGTLLEANKYRLLWVNDWRTIELLETDVTALVVADRVNKDTAVLPVDLPGHNGAKLVA